MFCFWDMKEKLSLKLQGMPRALIKHLLCVFYRQEILRRKLDETVYDSSIPPDFELSKYAVLMFKV